ncbi:MAG: gas vesicle protein [Acidobacteriota bacterium]
MSSVTRTSPNHSIQSTNLADILDRVLDKGVVIAGDIKIRLVDVELLTLQIRLVVCSVDRAVDMGIDWWRRDPHLLGSAAAEALPESETVEQLKARVEQLEADLAARSET